MAIIFLDFYMAINLVYKYWKFNLKIHLICKCINVGYYKTHLLVNTKNKKIAQSTIDVY